MARLRVFRLRHPPALDERAFAERARTFWPATAHALAQRVGGWRAAAGVRSLDVARGLVRYQDAERLWHHAVRPRLPPVAEARSAAERWLRASNLAAPAAGRWVVTRPGRVASSRVVIARSDDPRGTREEHTLDLQVAFTTAIVTDDRTLAPVIGGGGRRNVVLGDGGVVVGAYAPLASIDPEGFLVEAVSAEESTRAYRRRTAHLDVVEHTVSLAWRWDNDPRSPFVYPVYVHRAKAHVGERLVPLRLVALPATEIGPLPPAPRVPPPARTRSARRASPARTAPVKPGTRKRKTLDGGVSKDANEVGASWICELGGLVHAADNAQGFLTAMADAGWAVGFNEGEGEALEKHWTVGNDDFVDAVDLAFYTGHAGPEGWVLVDPAGNDDSVDFTEVGASPGSDRWGMLDLEWLVVAACGPLQDASLAAGGGDVLTRWAGAFDGLHQILGYGSESYDTGAEGEAFATYALAGDTVKDAWFKAAQESQGDVVPEDGAVVYAGAMCAYRTEGVSPFEDRLWGVGSVCEDPLAPKWLSAMWSPV